MTRPLERFSAHTIVDPARLQEQLRTIRADGYGYTVEELEVGLNAVAAPIYSADAPSWPYFEHAFAACQHRQLLLELVHPRRRAQMLLGHVPCQRLQALRPAALLQATGARPELPLVGEVVN